MEKEQEDLLSFGKRTQVAFSHLNPHQRLMTHSNVSLLLGHFTRIILALTTLSRARALVAGLETVFPFN